jgi:endonuclease/exonuclease/phosphatase family metal-dependent hydrolase
MVLRAHASRGAAHRGGADDAPGLVHGHRREAAALSLAIVGLFLLSTAAAAALDVPVAGKRLTMRGAPRRQLRVELRDGRIAAPFVAPTAGALLTLNGGAAPGQCYLEMPLVGRWRPLRGDGELHGWKWKGPEAGAPGLTQVLVRPGRVLIQGKGTALPCALGASAERLPVTVTLTLGALRWCSSFGGSVRTNRPGRLAAHDALPPAACPRTDARVATLNVLHGLFCPEPTPDRKCRYTDRIALLGAWIVARGCPDVVTLQEIWQPQAPLVESLLAGICPFSYEVVYPLVNRVDDAIVLSRYAVAGFAVQKLYGGFRHAVHVRIDHPLGPLDVFTTHLASESDGGSQPCGALGACPAECVRDGAATVRDCQATQLAAWVATVHGELPIPAFVTGDFNSSPGSFVYTRFTDRGLVDTYLAAGNPECEPATRVGCTSGRQDEDLSQLEDPSRNEHERIDFLFEIPPAARRCQLDGPDDPDHDGTGTRLFADQPNPFAPTCGPAPAAICWPSDHLGAEADLDCG